MRRTPEREPQQDGADRQDETAWRAHAPAAMRLIVLDSVMSVANSDGRTITPEFNVWWDIVAMDSDATYTGHHVDGTTTEIPRSPPTSESMGKSTTCRIPTMKVTEKGQVTIPKELRDALGIGAGTEVEFARSDDAIVVRKARDAPTRGRQLVERLRGRGDVEMTTDEIMALTRQP